MKTKKAFIFLILSTVLFIVLIWINNYVKSIDLVEWIDKSIGNTIGIIAFINIVICAGSIGSIITNAVYKDEDK